jgi:hypothetical protein
VGRSLPVLPLLLLIAVNAVCGVTFVQMKDALELYPLLAFRPESSWPSRPRPMRGAPSAPKGPVLEDKTCYKGT